ncbi:MAG: ROK family glucokinase [Actinobacteria bacterium]|nr:ROK family glucokinase [Actinomycetota bacterium]
MSATIGLDIGGTKISGGVINGSGVVLAKGRKDTPAHDPVAIVEEAANLIRELSLEHKIDAVGVACAGFIDRSGSRVLFSPNLAWRDEPFKQHLESVVNLPVILENDANAATWGEFRFGAGTEADDMVMVTVGTGIGGGIVVDGVLMHGAFGVAAELGHMRVVPGGIRCGCGNRGCWEQYASGSALVREARELVVSGTPHAARLGEMCRGDLAALSGPDVTRAAVEGDPAAAELLADLGAWIGEGLASVAAILDPELVVLGGGVSEAGGLLIDPALAAFRRQLTGRGHRPEARFALASLGNDAGMIGAADLAAATCL